LQPEQCDVAVCDNVEEKTPNEILDTPPRRSTCKRRPPTYLEDFQTTNSVSSIYRIQSFLSYNVLSYHFKNTILSISSDMELHNYAEASKHSC